MLFDRFQRSAQTQRAGGEPAIEMRRIVKKFKTPVGDVTVLKGIDTRFSSGEFVGVIGKSGSGKSTLVNMLTGIDKPTSGEVQIGDTLVHRLSESQMARWRGLNMGIVFQFYQLLPVLTLLENTMLPMDISRRFPSSEREMRAMELLRLVGLEDVAHKSPAAVSGGQQQAAAIARALANDPPFLIADEPTGNLDSRTAENIFQIFEGLVDQGKTIIMVTHDPNLARRTTRTLLLCDGEVIHPAVASALPWLVHTRMLKITKQATAHSHESGAVISGPGQPVDAWTLITAGAVEFRDPAGHRLGRLSAGQYFGQAALLERRAARHSAVAVEPVELLALDRGLFDEILAGPLAVHLRDETHPPQVDL